MRILLISLILSGMASAQVPSLINYQGRLTNAEGEPLTGTKKFEVNIFDAQTGGNLLYTETFDSVTLGEGGVYNFLFGEAGTSNAQVTETVGNGNGENLYQKILGNEDIVDGTISVTDGTYTWSQESGSSNEDDFSASYSKNLRRITVNYFTDAPNDSREISVIYRHQKTGITGALTGGDEQWMELTVDGETQTTRQRIGAVPYALKAGTADTAGNSNSVSTMEMTSPQFFLPGTVNRIEKIRFIGAVSKSSLTGEGYGIKYQIRRFSSGSGSFRKMLRIKEWFSHEGDFSGEIVYESQTVLNGLENGKEEDGGTIIHEFNLAFPNLKFDHENFIYYILAFYQKRDLGPYEISAPGDSINIIYYK